MVPKKFRSLLPLLVLSLVCAVQTASAGPTASRWTLGTQGEVLWHVSDATNLPHKDHMAMDQIKAFGRTWNLNITRRGVNLNVRVSDMANQTLYEQTLPSGSSDAINLSPQKDGS